MIKRVCDICEKENEIFFKCKIKRHMLSFDYPSQPFDDPIFFRSEICEDCLKKIAELRKERQ